MTCQRCGAQTSRRLCVPCAREQRRDQTVGDDGVRYDVEVDAGVPAGEGESFAAVAARLRDQYPSTLPTADSGEVTSE